MPRVLLALAAAVAALALAACSEDTAEQNDYVDDVNGVTSTLNSELSQISTDVGSIQNPADAAKAFADFASTLRSAANEISEIDPPEEVAELHDRLVQEVETLAAEARNVVDEVRQGGPAAVIGVATGFLSSANRLSGEVDSTIDEINSTLQD